MIRKIKPGYIIIAIVLIFFLYKKFFDNSKEIALYTKKVNTLLTDLRHQDYFNYQERLDASLKRSVSIEDLQNFMEKIDLQRGAKFILKDYQKENNIVKIEGVIVVNSKKELKFNTTFVDNNGTFLIKSQKIGNLELKEEKLAFPILCKSSSNK